jgi:hypothetical protein
MNFKVILLNYNKETAHVFYCQAIPFPIINYRVLMICVIADLMQRNNFKQILPNSYGDVSTGTHLFCAGERSHHKGVLGCGGMALRIL